MSLAQARLFSCQSRSEGWNSRSFCKVFWEDISHLLLEEKGVVQLLLTRADIYPQINFKQISRHIKDLERLYMHINVLLLLLFDRLIWKTCPYPNNWDFFIWEGSSIVGVLIQSQTDGSESSLLFFLLYVLSGLTSFPLHSRFPSQSCGVNWTANVSFNVWGSSRFFEGM